MSEDRKRNVAMVICAPLADIRKQINKTIAGVQSHKSQGGFRCELYVVVADCPRTRAEQVKADLDELTAKHWQDRRDILTPLELEELSRKGAREQRRTLAEYLAYGLIKRVIR